MLFSSSQNLEDRIVELLLHDRLPLGTLHKRLIEEEEVSLRGVYKAINKLLRARVLLKVGKRVMVDQEWAMRSSQEIGSLSAPLLSEGERVAYTFTSIVHLDAFWLTTVIPLERAVATHEVFFYNPHNFWAYLAEPRASEDAYYAHLAETKKHSFFTIGGEYAADREFKKEYQSDYLQIDLKKHSFFQATDHVTLIGAFVITVRVGKELAATIDSLYRSEKPMAQILPEIERVCRKPGKIRFVIENNAGKAEKIRKILARNFYFKN